MVHAFAAIVKSDRLILSVVLVFAILVLAIPIDRAPVWGPKNARWVLLAPQLFAWAIALASLPPGHVTEFTAAVPSLVSAVRAPTNRRDRPGRIAPRPRGSVAGRNTVGSVDIVVVRR